MAAGEMFNVTKGTGPTAEEKVRLYEQLAASLQSMLLGESDTVMIMSTVVAALHHTMPHFFWTGFYRVAGDELLIGPYQGTPACLRISRGRGVCGTAWSEKRALVVPDVHAFPGHITCDARSASEIVVPWFDAQGNMVAVLDVDSTLPAAFDEIDCHALCALARQHPFDLA